MFATDRTRSRRGRAVNALLIAFALVVSSLFGLIHQATTKHVVCAQHGELIDGDADGGPAASTPSAVERPRDEAQRSITRGSSKLVVHGHEHCSLVSAMRESRVMPRPPAIEPALAAIDDVVIATPRDGIAQHEALYRTAPKTSPPA